MRRYIQPQPSQPRISLKGIPTGYLGTAKTLDHMQALIRQGVKDFNVRQKAIDILLARGVEPKDYLGEIEALFEWVQKNIRYTKDPYRVEVLHTARKMLELRAGDCDDMTILLGAMLEAVGHPVRMVIVGPDPARPRFFSHIYLEVSYEGHWIALDATMPFPMGWKPQMLVKMVVPIDRDLDKRSGVFGALNATGANQVAAWIPALIQAVRSRAIRPSDPRVEHLIQLLRRRGLWGQNRWLRLFLISTWRHGLTARPRAQIAARLTRLLRGWKLLPVTGQMQTAQGGRNGHHPFQPIASKPVQRVAADSRHRLAMQQVARLEREGLEGCG